MGAIPFLIFFWWLACKMEMRCDKRLQEHREIERNLDAAIKRVRNFKTDSKPKYRMKEVDSDTDELFMTDLGDFDEAFKL